MKKIFLGIICLAITAGFYSCNNNGQDFQVIGYSAYGVQTGNQEFRPIVAFSVGYGDLENSTARISHDGVPVQISVLTKNIAEANTRYYSVSEMSGTYSFSGTSTEGDPATAQLTMSFKDPIGEMEIEDFVYQNGTLKMTVVTPVENAVNYGFYIRPMGEDGGPYPSWIYDNNIIVDQTPVKSGEQEISHSFSFSNLSFLADEVIIYPAVYHGSNESTTLIRLGEGKVLRKDATSFTE